MPGVEAPAITVLDRLASRAVEAAFFIARENVRTADDESELSAEPVARDQLVERGQRVRLVGGKVGIKEVEARQVARLIIRPDAMPEAEINAVPGTIPDPVGNRTADTLPDRMPDVPPDLVSDALQDEVTHV